MDIIRNLLHLLLVLVVSYICAANTYPTCPMATPCVCKVQPNRRVTITCSGKGLTEEQIPEFNSSTGTTVESLDLRSNRIKTLSESFQTSVMADTLLLGNNLLTAVPSNMTGIKHLDIRGNHITSLVKNNLVNNSLIQTLHLEANQITSIDVHAMVNLGLKTLSLKSNSLHSLPNEVFKELKLLEELLLDDNHLQYLSHWYYSTSVMKKISIKNNLLSEISDSCFQYYPRLTHLYLENNRIEKLSNKSFAGLGGLQTLHLAVNQLRYIGENYLSSLTSLTQLYLNNNPLVAINPRALPVRSRLAYLALDYTHLDGFPLELMQNLPNLQILSYNGFQGTNLHNLSSLHQLTTLWISESKVTKIYQCELDPLPRLSSLKLDAVPLECDCDMAWLRDISQAFSGANEWKCNSPSHVKGKKFIKVPMKDFRCTNRIKTECNLQMTSTEQWTTGIPLATKPAEPVTQVVQHQDVHYTKHHPMYMVHLGTTKITASEIHLHWTTNIPRESIEHFNVYYKKASATTDELPDQLIQVRTSSECTVKNLYVGAHYNVCIDVLMREDKMQEDAMASGNIKKDVVTPNDNKEDIMTPDNSMRGIVAQCIQVRTSLFPVTIAISITGGILFIVCLAGAICWRMKFRKANGVERGQSQPAPISSPHILGLPPAYSNNAYAHGMEASGGDGEVRKTCPEDEERGSEDYSRF